MKASLGLDIGTTSVKAVALTGAGEIVAAGSSAPLALTAPRPGCAVQSTADLQAAVLQCLSATAEHLPPDIELVGLSSAVQSGSLVTVDDAGVPAAELITWMDTRTADIVERWNSDGTAEIIRQRTGWSVQTGLGLPQLVWLRSYDRQRWDELSRAASADDFVASLLTGSWVTNPSNAAGMALMDIATGRWSPEMCDLADIGHDQLSSMHATGFGIGGLTESVAEATGLPAGLPVINGGHDQTATALALGVSEPHRALLACGTAWVVTAVLEADNLDALPSQMNLSFHVIDGLRTASQYLGGLGASMEWWLHEATFEEPDGPDRYAVLDVELRDSAIAAASPFFLRTSDHSLEAQRPGTGRFFNTQTDSSRAAKARAIMEFAAFEVRTALAALPPTHRPTELTIVGGSTKAQGWAQLLSDACELPVRMAPDRSWPAVGAALIAGVALGLFADIESAVTAVETETTHLQPNPSSVELHNRRYPTHLDLKQEHTP